MLHLMQKCTLLKPKKARLNAEAESFKITKTGCPKASCFVFKGSLILNGGSIYPSPKFNTAGRPKSRPPIPNYRFAKI